MSLGAWFYLAVGIAFLVRIQKALHEIVSLTRITAEQISAIAKSTENNSISGTGTNAPPRLSLGFRT